MLLPFNSTVSHEVARQGVKSETGFVAVSCRQAEIKQVNSYNTSET